RFSAIDFEVRAVFRIIGALRNHQQNSRALLACGFQKARAKRFLTKKFSSTITVQRIMSMKRLLLLVSILLTASTLCAQEAKSDKQAHDAKAEALKQAEAQAKLDAPQEATTDVLAAPAVEAKPVNPKADLRQERSRHASSDATSSERKATANDAKKED
ncbi:MAG: hypothetical protein RMJ55_20510, partial [Roseiflexaceae bacterium]|nr:hypothetical protein [Roseiflexaceae bacterium]